MTYDLDRPTYEYERLAARHASLLKRHRRLLSASVRFLEAHSRTFLRAGYTVPNESMRVFLDQLAEGREV